jgi:hypothetical protein
LEAPAPAPPVAPAPAAAAPAGQAGATGQVVPSPTFEFILGGKSENIVPTITHDAKVEDGKADITTEPNTLKCVITGAAGANVFLGAESEATESIQVTQEFDVTSSNPAISQVVLTLESSLNGFIRSKHKGTASVRLASATIAPAGYPSAPLYVSYPMYFVSGAQGYKYSDPQPPMTSPPLPLGHYVLQANFSLQATASGLLDGHATAIFVPESEALDPWEREHDPFAGDPHDDFGFTITLKADSPPGFPPVAKRKTPGRVALRGTRSASASR